MRGPQVRSLGLPLPPARMPLLSRGPAAQALALRGALPARPDGLRGRRARGRAAAALVGAWRCRTAPSPSAPTAGRGGVDLSPGRARVDADGVSVDLDVRRGRRAWRWPRRAGAPGSGRASRRRCACAGTCASASASGRWTATRASWTTPPATTSATPSGAGRRASGARSTGARWPGTWWTACTTRPSRASARSGWTASPPRSPPVAFADDLSRVGDLEFTPWCAREDHTRRLLFRSDYLQPFGSFEGELPGGLRLASGHGVMEWHDVRW